MEVVLDENGFLEYVKIDISRPPTIYVPNLPWWKKYLAKMMIIILEGVWDDIVSNLH